MGIYLSTPKTDKFSEDGENDRVRYGLSSMQGWRATMEDAHSAYPDLDASTSFFGVYDGHGVLFAASESVEHQLVSHEHVDPVADLSETLNQLSIAVQFPSSDVNYNSNYCSMATFSYSQNICGVHIPGKVVAKFCANYLHRQVLKNEAYAAGEIGTSVQKAFFRMDEMMRGQRGWRELAALGDKMNRFTGMIEGLIWSPRGADSNDKNDDWAFEEGPHSDFAGPTAGSTACIAIIRNNKLVVANAGDSRCVLSRKGQAYNLSRDHKPDLEAEKERILKAGGFIHAGRVNGSLNLARAIGDVEFKQNKFLPAERQIVTANPDINTVDLCEEDDFIVLACDGIWDCMSSQQLVDFVHEQLISETKLSAVCERVLDRCLAPSTANGEGCDNMTMVLVQFKKPSQTITEPIEELSLPPESADGALNPGDNQPKLEEVESK